MYAVLHKAYSDRGFEEQIFMHHQGGLIGYKCRHWIAQPHGKQLIEPGRCYAWNPTIAGATLGTKSEDTIYLSKEDGETFEVLTQSPDWPMVDIVLPDGREMARPDILQIPSVYCNPLSADGSQERSWEVIPQESLSELQAKFNITVPGTPPQTPQSAAKTPGNESVWTPSPFSGEAIQAIKAHDFYVLLALFAMASFALALSCFQMIRNSWRPKQARQEFLMHT
eukprot:gnl/TRDRNA2_/TRDRNA2_72055_c0_seq2.p1 gnl/TRDRNA2_/TRDRNA2_72055_c0~~gnl/TRDRNA2_/TRDRNA2_72055_c0_seq2.p1  ORF type:complete len:246 (+),score=32.69 gnl/TRDRNA2_/TRDRNA2_72055_c0_seq2:66-740(+)